MECFRGFSLRLRPRGLTTALDPSPTILSLVELFVPMHRARGRLVAPPADGRLLRMRGVSGRKGRSTGAPPATPEATSRSGVRHSPRLSAASASASAAAAATTAAAAVSAARDTDDVEVCVGESQPLLSPPARLVAKSCICDWEFSASCRTCSPIRVSVRGAIFSCITFARVSGNGVRVTGILLLVFVAFTTLIINIGVRRKRLTRPWRRRRVLYLRQRW